MCESLTSMNFSVVIPTLNEEKYIGTILTALVGQTHKDFEVLVSDGGSEDKTLRIVSEFRNYLDLRTIRSYKKGISYGRNLGAKHSKHEHLVFFDADVSPEKRFLEKLSQKILSDSFQVASSWPDPLSGKLIDELIWKSFNLLYLEVVKHISPGAPGFFIYVRKDAFLSVKGFDESMLVAEDFDFIHRIHCAGYKYKLFRDPKISISVRRLDEDGRLKFVTKMLSAGVEYHLFGSHSSKFRDESWHELGKHK